MNGKTEDMEISRSLTSLHNRLMSGEQVVCYSCHKGHYQPLNPSAKVNHSFICDNCGDHYHWDPDIFVE